MQQKLSLKTYSPETMRISIAIPVYKTLPSTDEVASLKQGLKVLNHYDTFLVCPQSLSTEAYDDIAGRKMTCKRFDDSLFANIGSYNRLMKSANFYQAFEDYDYVLIYQLDAWVFRDELTEWCQRGYDYIGAPWFHDYLSHEEGAPLWCAGNGGLSLRKVSKFLAVTAHPYGRLKSCRQVFRDEYHSIHDLGHSIIRCCGPLFGTNRVGHYLRNNRMTEDTFYSLALNGTRFSLNIPTPEIAARFAFEHSPSYLYNEVTNGQLPFGCHAWRKYHYEDFWKQFIGHELTDIHISKELQE